MGISRSLHLRREKQIRTLWASHQRMNKALTKLRIWIATNQHNIPLDIVALLFYVGEKSSKLETDRIDPKQTKGMIL